MRTTTFASLILALVTVSGARTPDTRDWTLVVQLPRDASIRIERAGGVLRGRPGSVIQRLARGRGGFLSLRRVVAGTVSIESPRVRQLQKAGSVLVVTIAVPAKRRVRVVSTNRMPISEDPGHLTVLNLQLVSEGELFVRSPFAVVDDPGRTAVLFQ